MSHAEMDQLYDVYALGALEREAAEEIDKHLDDQCAHCQARVRMALEMLAGVSMAAEQVTPPKSLRDRVAASVRPARRSRTWAFIVPALSAACAVLLVFSVWSTIEMRTMTDRLTALRGERDELRTAITLLSRSDTRAVQFGGAQNVPHGRVLLSREGGIVFVGSQLPPLASDKRYELWLIPGKGAPQAAGMFRPGALGECVHISPRAANRSTAAVAVTIEPWAGSTAPTTKPFLVVPLG